MVDYTWLVNLLREVEAFAVGGKHRELSKSVTIACETLLFDAENRAQIRSEARLWLENKTKGNDLLRPSAGKNIV